MRPLVRAHEPRDAAPPLAVGAARRRARGAARESASGALLVGGRGSTLVRLQEQRAAKPRAPPRWAAGLDGDRHSGGQTRARAGAGAADGRGARVRRLLWLATRLGLWRLGQIPAIDDVRVHPCLLPRQQGGAAPGGGAAVGRLLAARRRGGHRPAARDPGAVRPRARRGDAHGDGHRLAAHALHQLQPRRGRRQLAAADVLPGRGRAARRI
mmetsp:Transcript_6059/g.15855  ORF Transcript_6059/g.15855 Transcript_6059/m.15855 type:complete len:212 (-) Transcript_6059:41-676(-)